MKINIRNNSGMILILALWALGLLSVFAIYLGVAARQRMIFVSRIETRDSFCFIARSGIGKAIAFLDMQKRLNSYWKSSRFKESLMNNKKAFRDISLGGYTVDISYNVFDKTFRKTEKRYGMIDEGSKININKANRKTLSDLFQHTLGWDDEQANTLSLAIIDWREEHDSVLKGFFSGDYYENLKDPYEQKNSNFELFDEIFLIEGMNQDILDRLRPFVTVYGDGAINVNTASRQVLVAIGFSSDAAQKVLSIRRGPDEKEATLDDRIFQGNDDFLSVVKSAKTLSDFEIEKINQLVSEEKIATSSDFYSIDATAYKNHSEKQAFVRCVYNVEGQKIEYWNEE